MLLFLPFSLLSAFHAFHLIQRQSSQVLGHSTLKKYSRFSASQVIIVYARNYIFQFEKEFLQVKPKITTCMQDHVLNNFNFNFFHNISNYNSLVNTQKAYTSEIGNSSKFFNQFQMWCELFASLSYRLYSDHSLTKKTLIK